MNKFFVPAALLLGSTSISAVQADTNPDTIVVTASRTAQTVDEALASVTVIDREEIERKQVQTVNELLSTTPGVMTVDNGGRGKTSSLYLRGTNSDQVLVMIDGIKVGSTTSGSMAFEHLAIDQIERVEIVRGPRSSLYGSEAIGGVIQIFTRRGTQGLTPRFSAGLGSNDSHEVTFGASGGNDNGWFSADISDYSTDGIDVREGVANHDPDDDGYDNRSWSLNGGYRFTDWASAQLHWTRNEGDSDYDNYASSESDLETLGGTLSLTPTDNWALDLSLGRSKDEAAQYSRGEYQSHIDTERDTASIVSHHILNENNELSWGVDYQEDKVSSSNEYTGTSRDNTGVFGLYQVYLGAHDLAFSLRTDDDEQFGRHNTGSIAWGVQLDPDLRLFASYGTAFRAPDLNDLYWPYEDYGDWGTYEGNPDIKPEESKSLEFGLSGTHAGVQWSANVYQTEIDNLIDWADISETSTPRNVPQNVDEARIRGIELTAATQLAGWNLVSNLDLMDPENREDGSMLDRRPRRMLNLSADRDFGVWSAGVSTQSVSERNDGSDQLGGYTLVNLRGAYKLTQDWSLRARVANLFDKEYETARNYNQPDREFWLSIHYTPGS
ncbi:TonB-dependent vitamin B12 receptor [Marinobacterium lutimaris]|uniref:Vitamin B12 transporter n=1 Tax=Marinobacterium lutimaris TaxID=568106 RepID=A0A1H6DCB9_9GAMM|nr:TonB-dependent vitamin B12 receptor [Marinobacterium lutimaris]SEG82096.1 vitamin B12 transporter [Marinobacterium lutimaris]